MDRYLARQPIFHADKTVFAYEILSRFGPENYFRADAKGAQHASAMDELFLMGIQRMTQGLPAFLNCTREFLLGDYLALLPKEAIVGEILETVKPEEDVLAACHRMRDLGYRLALDDYEDRLEMKPFLDVADFVKVDFMLTGPDERVRLAKKFRNWGIPLIAEKVESEEEFNSGVEIGYEYFQGYFFCRPQMVSRKEVPANSAMYLRLMQAIYKPETNLIEIAEILKQEASLSYRLLRYLNSPAFPLIADIHSIPQAVTLLGERLLKKWIALVCVAGIGEGKPPELVKIPLLRARFCELLGEKAGMASQANDLFLLGLLSMMDVLLEKPMTEVLEDLPVNEEIKDALSGKAGNLRRILEVALEYDAGNWEKLSESSEALGLKEYAIPELHLKAIEWADEVLSETPATVHQ